MNEIDAAIKQTHPDFTITCDKCKSERVKVDITIGFSATSGAWGGIDLECVDCGASTEIWRPY